MDPENLQKLPFIRFFSSLYSNLNLPLVCIVVFSTIFLSLDLNSWRYSCIGDEWAIYQRASTILRNGIFRGTNIFGPLSNGVYGVHTPFLSSVQALVMFFFGDSNFGWRMSGVLACTLSAFPVFIIARYFLSTPASYLVAISTIWSYFLMAESRWGYGWGLMRFFSLIAIASLVIYVGKPTKYRAALVGVTCSASTLIGGLASYILPLVFLYLVIFTVRRRGLQCMLLIFIAVASCLVTSKIPQHYYGMGSEGVVQQLQSTLWKTSAGPYVASLFGPSWGTSFEASAPPPEQFWSTFLNMLGRTMLAPYTYKGHSHYVSGRAVEPLWAILAMLGMGLSLLFIRRNRKWLHVWVFFIPAVILAGALTPYHDLAVTRLHFLVPFWALFVGLAFERITSYFARREAITGVVVGLYASWLVIWGSYKLWIDMPQSHSFTHQALAMRHIQEEPSSRHLFLFNYWHPLDLIIPHYPGTSGAAVVTESNTETLVASLSQVNSILVFPSYQELDDEDRKLYDLFKVSVGDSAICSIEKRYSNVVFELCRAK